MNYVENVHSILDGTAVVGNGIEHTLVSIVREARTRGCARRKFVVMNNLCFLQLEAFRGDWRQELTRFCSEFGLFFSMTDDESTIEFWNRDRMSRGKAQFA